MEIRYNVTGERRKALVQAVADATGARPVYKRMPTCNYEVGIFTITRDGTLIFDDCSDTEGVGKVLDKIAAAGFECEMAALSERTAEQPSEPHSAPCGADSGDTSVFSAESGKLPNEPKDATQGETGGLPAESTGLSVSLPLDGFDADALARLEKLVSSKASLIKKALGADRLTVETDGDKVSFPWRDRLPDAEEIQTYMAFIAALGKMARESRRVTATEKAVDSEKYAFRGFLLRLGFIGADCKAQRKLLLKNLSGSAAFPNKEKADAFSQSQKAKRDAAKEVLA